MLSGALSTTAITPEERNTTAVPATGTTPSGVTDQAGTAKCLRARARGLCRYRQVRRRCAKTCSGISIHNHSTFPFLFVSPNILGTSSANSV